MDINSLAHTKWNCKYHIVFAPKYRRKVAYGKMKQDIANILSMLCKTPVYNFINYRLVDKSTVLKPLSQSLILYVFRYFSRKWQKISVYGFPDLIQNETPVHFLYGIQKNIYPDKAGSSWHSN